MANYFNIYFNDLTFEKQEEIRDLIRQRTIENTDLMTQFKEEAEDDEERAKREYEEFCKKFPKHKLAKSYKPLDIKTQIEQYIEEEIRDQINRNFSAKGEV